MAQKPVYSNSDDVQRLLWPEDAKTHITQEHTMMQPSLAAPMAESWMFELPNIIHFRYGHNEP